MSVPNKLILLETIVCDDKNLPQMKKQVENLIHFKNIFSRRNINPYFKNQIRTLHKHLSLLVKKYKNNLLQTVANAEW